ncbi:hypothetical protein O1611_g5900 [Lasiodiplodia mahajangana]|uniref:Uncharacterized protein n=1 Tax=Lasiodiplodia mahajangana TaxID=1108764 RepID=A0ACC2JK80_9PEZI|nr:hypothetical protein O1611_g5900 [Lasiodiplodia mahajangana]
MVAFARKRRGPRPSKYLPDDIEDGLRHLVLDGVEDFRPVGGDAPQLIIPNPESGCHGTYFIRRSGIEFFFHHSAQCDCLIEGTPGVTTYQIPPILDDFRIQLIHGINVPFRLEPNLAAMVVMKTFLAMYVPKELRMSVEVDDPATDLAEREEIPDSGKGKGRQLEGIPEEESQDVDEWEGIEDEETQERDKQGGGGITTMASRETRDAGYSHLLKEEVTSIWLVELKRGIWHDCPAARGWALALVAEDTTVVVGPKIIEEKDHHICGRMSPIEGDAIDAVSRMETITEAGYARRLKPGTLVDDLLRLLKGSGIKYGRARDGRGLRFWLCSLFFLWRDYIVDTPGDTLPEKAVALTRRCSKDGDTMASMPIEKGMYPWLNIEGIEANKACEQWIAHLREKEGF